MANTRTETLTCEDCDKATDFILTYESDEFFSGWVFDTEPECPHCGNTTFAELSNCPSDKREDFHADG